MDESFIEVVFCFVRIEFEGGERLNICGLMLFINLLLWLLFIVVVLENILFMVIVFVVNFWRLRVFMFLKENKKIVDGVYLFNYDVGECDFKLGKYSLVKFSFY